MRKSLYVSPLKAIVLCARLALLTATPAVAQSYDPDLGTGNIAPPVQAAQVARNAHAPALPRAAQFARNAYARATPRLARGARNAYARVTPDAFQSWNAFGELGDGFGTDPDPNIRFQLHRESLQGRW